MQCLHATENALLLFPDLVKEAEKLGKSLTTIFDVVILLKDTKYIAHLYTATTGRAAHERVAEGAPSTDSTKALDSLLSWMAAALHHHDQLSGGKILPVIPADHSMSVVHQGPGAINKRFLSKAHGVGPV